MSPKSSKKSGIRSGPDDIAFLADCGRYGTLSTSEASDYFPALKPNSVLRRLRLMAQNGLTSTTRIEVWRTDEPSKGGRIPTLHSLTEVGADLVESVTGDRPQRILRSRPAAATFLHRREIVRVMRAFDQGCDAAKLQRPDWIMEQDAWHAAPKGLPPNQRRQLYHDFGNGVTCLPDIACRLVIGSTTLVLFWEVDLSTEGRKQLRKASKTTGYVELIKQQAFRRYWPSTIDARCFVLWVTPTTKRFEGLRATIGKHDVGGACRMLAATALDNPTNLLTNAHWQTMTGELRAIYRPKRETDS